MGCSQDTRINAPTTTYSAIGSLKQGPDCMLVKVTSKGQHLLQNSVHCHCTYKYKTEYKIETPTNTFAGN